jgi:hypothetical protein
VPVIGQAHSTANGRTGGAALTAESSNATEIFTTVYGDYGVLRSPGRLAAFFANSCNTSVVTGAHARAYAAGQGLHDGDVDDGVGVTTCRDNHGLLEAVNACAPVATLSDCVVVAGQCCGCFERALSGCNSDMRTQWLVITVGRLPVHCAHAQQACRMRPDIVYNAARCCIPTLSRRMRCRTAAAALETCVTHQPPPLLATCLGGDGDMASAPCAVAAAQMLGVPVAVTTVLGNAANQTNAGCAELDTVCRNFRVLAAGMQAGMSTTDCLCHCLRHKLVRALIAACTAELAACTLGFAHHIYRADNHEHWSQRYRRPAVLQEACEGASMELQAATLDDARAALDAQVLMLDSDNTTSAAAPEPLVVCAPKPSGDPCAPNGAALAAGSAAAACLLGLILAALLSLGI